NGVLDRVDSVFAQMRKAYESVDETPTPPSIGAEGATGTSATLQRAASSDRLFEMYKIFSSCVAQVREASQKLAEGPQ
ncbi:hypothetical protein AAVH_23710, partial [Aphelenchoides avenae]